MASNNLKSLLEASFHWKCKDASEAQKFVYSAVYLPSSFN